MDKFTDPVHVVQSNKSLSSYFSHNWNGNAFEIVELDQIQNIFPKNFKDHYEVLAILTMVKEPVEHLKIIGVFSCDLEPTSIIFLSQIILHRFHPLWMCVIVSQYFKNSLFIES